MRIAHTGAATPSASLEGDILTAARLGADGLEIWAPKLASVLERTLARRLGADPTGWARRLRERALALERDSRESTSA